MSVRPAVFGVIFMGFVIQTVNNKEVQPEGQIDSRADLSLLSSSTNVFPLREPNRRCADKWRHEGVVSIRGISMYKKGKYSWSRKAKKKRR